jgi:predicted XRE-type DNA-binding protein
MSNIPLAREALMDVAVRLFALSHPTEAKRIVDIVDTHMTREGRANIAPARSVKITPAIVAGVKEFVSKHPRASQAEVGAVFGINAGRVSEILNGKRWA